MKLFAHRGWSAGPKENTILAFKKSISAGIDGVELDVRFGADRQTVVVSHDPVLGSTPPTLDEILTCLNEIDFELLIEFKEYSDVFYASVIKSLRKYNFINRTTIFAFPKEAEQFPWSDRKDVKLGIIAPYPKDIKRYINVYAPDMVLLGWGNKKERLQFRIAWWVLSLPKTFSKYATIKFVIGVAYGAGDQKWLSKQTGLYGFVADLPLK